jgi:hypothetical protein
MVVEVRNNEEKKERECDFLNNNIFSRKMAELV